MASNSPFPFKVDSLAGHLGHLSTEQEKAFTQFKQQCIDNYPRQQSSVVPSDSREGIDDDGTLLRFLRARRFNVAAAFQQYSTTVTWRRTNSLEFLYENIDIKDFDDTKNLYTHWTGRRDRAGVPVYVLELSHLTSDKMSAYDKSCAARPTPFPKGETAPRTPVKMLRLFATYEHLIRFVMPLCSVIPGRPRSETPITQTVCIIDMSGVGLMQFWMLRKHLQDASILATAHYPETLGRTFVIGAPKFFPTVWGWIKAWFDPITTSKILILSTAEVLPTLTSYIEPRDIPKKYGGELDFDFGMEPILDADIVDMLSWAVPAKDLSKQKFPLGPVKWVNESTGEIRAIAVGVRDGLARKEEVASLKKGEKVESDSELSIAADRTTSPEI